MTCSANINIYSQHTGRAHEEMAPLQLRTERQVEGQDIFDYVQGTSISRSLNTPSPWGLRLLHDPTHWNLPTSSQSRFQSRSITSVAGGQLPLALGIKPDASPASRAARRSVRCAILVVVPVRWIWWITAHGGGVAVRSKKIRIDLVE